MKLTLLQAKKFYESALRLEPGYLGAALALAELHVIEGRNGDAVTLLERYLKDWADDSLHVKLAQVFAATNMLQDALSHYQAALRYVNPCIQVYLKLLAFSSDSIVCYPIENFLWAFWGMRNSEEELGARAIGNLCATIQRFSRNKVIWFSVISLQMLHYITGKLLITIGCLKLH